ncbi:hypothetical protein GGR54DRAFT_161928 [Hypoxylon sp. NC1633]|nr:hypothetical protein GGR54DRAFT_161928 [Hypoxylon sp. NC1633]
MEEQKHTPNRRRQGGRNRHTPQQKKYASENDVAPKSNPAMSPSTPNSKGVQTLRPSLSQSNSKNKSGNKPRNKNGAASQGQYKHTLVTPFLQSNKNSTVPIFAGSTFHASPAPSALPIPKFFGKPSVDSPTTKADSSPDQGLYSATSNSDEASPPSPTPISRTEESPLELFFRADRAEKAKTHRASSDHASATGPGPFSPPRDSPKEFATFPKAAGSIPTHRSNVPRRASALGIPADELDGNPSQPVGPAFSTPYQERLRAVGSRHNSAQTTPTVLQRKDMNSSEAMSSSEALKRYLFTGSLSQGQEERHLHQATTPSRQPSQQPSRQQWHQARHQLGQHQIPQHPSPQHHLPRGMFPASILAANAQSHQTTSPPANVQLASHNSKQTIAMEDRLRRVLKLDSPGQSLPLH